MVPLSRVVAGVPLALLSCTFLCACAENDARFTAQLSLLSSPVGVGQKLMLVERTSATAFLLDAQSADPAPLRVSVLPEPTRVVPRRAHGDQALVLSAGVSGDRNSTQAPGGLTLVRGDGSVSTFPIGNDPFDFVVQQPAGRYAALLRGWRSTQLLQNANEMVLVDLESDSADDAARLVTLPEAPRAVFFSEDFALDGRALQLAVVLTDNTAAVFELERPEALPVLIQLNADPALPLFPQDVRFDPLNARFYIRSAGTDDIFSLRLVPRSVGADRSSFGVSIDIVAAGHLPSDMQLFELDGTNRLLVISPGSQSASIVDVATSRTTAVRLPDAFDQALVYYMGDGGERLPHALLWGEHSGALATLALDAASTVALDQGLTSLPGLPFGARETVPFADGTVAFFGFAPNITLVDPVRGSVTPYNAAGFIADGFLDQQRALLWLAPSGQPRVAHLDLTTGGTDEMLLDDDVLTATLIPDAQRMGVVHDDRIGHVTFINLDDPRRATSVGVRGFLFEGAFE